MLGRVEFKLGVNLYSEVVYFSLKNDNILTIFHAF